MARVVIIAEMHWRKLLLVLGATSNPKTPSTMAIIHIVKAVVFFVVTVTVAFWEMAAAAG
jgi:hypothetical protein